MKWNPALMRVCAYGRMGGFAGSAGGPRPAPRSPRPAPPRLPAAHWRGGARPRTPIFSRPVGPPRHPAALPPRPSLHASPARLAAVAPRVARPPTPSKLFPPGARARAGGAPNKKNKKNVWRISKGHPRIRMYECVEQNLRNGIPRRLPPLFARADARGGARARRARSRSSPREATSKRVEKVVPLGRIAPLGIRKIRAAALLFPDPGPPAAGARARARIRGFAERNAADRDFAARRNVNGLARARSIRSDMQRAPSQSCASPAGCAPASKSFQRPPPSARFAQFYPSYSWGISAPPPTPARRCTCWGSEMFDEERG